MDTRADEQERGITIKSTGVSMFFKYDASKYYEATEEQKTMEDLEEEAAAAAAAAGQSEGDAAALVCDSFALSFRKFFTPQSLTPCPSPPLCAYFRPHPPSTPRTRTKTT